MSRRTVNPESVSEVVLAGRGIAKRNELVFGKDIESARKSHAGSSPHIPGKTCRGLVRVSVVVAVNGAVEGVEGFYAGATDAGGVTVG